MGSLLIGFMIYFAGLILIFILQPFLNKKPWINKCFVKLKKMFLYNSIVAMMMESYSLICVSCLIACYHISFQSHGEIVQTLFNLLFCALIFAFPAIMIIYVSKNWDPVNKSWGNLRIIKQRFGAMFEELSMEKGPKVLIYPCYFMFRRLLLAIIVVIFKEFLWMQIFLNAMSIIIAVVILGEADYFETRFKRTMEFTNEVLVMFMLYNMISFSPLVPEIQTRFYVGYFCCIVEAFALAANLYLIIFSSIKGGILRIKIWYAKRDLMKGKTEHQKERAKGKLLRKLLRQQRANDLWDYGYEENREEAEQEVEEDESDEEQEEEEEEVEQEEMITRAPRIRRRHYPKFKVSQMITKLEQIGEQENESQSEDEIDLEQQSSERLQDKSCGLIVEGELYPWLVNQPRKNSSEELNEQDDNSWQMTFLEDKKLKVEPQAYEVDQVQANAAQLSNLLMLVPIGNQNDLIEEEEPPLILSKKERIRSLRYNFELKTLMNSMEAAELQSKATLQTPVKSNQVLPTSAHWSRPSNVEALFQEVESLEIEEVKIADQTRERTYDEILDEVQQLNKVKKRENREADKVQIPNKLVKRGNRLSKHQSNQSKQQSDSQPDVVLLKPKKQKKKDSLLGIIMECEDEFGKTDAWEELEKLPSNRKNLKSQKQVDQYLGLLLPSRKHKKANIDQL